MQMCSELPLLNAQLGVWFALKTGVPAPNFNIGGYVEIFGGLDPRLFEKALNEVVRETQALRVRFHDRGDGPRQEILAHFDWRLMYLDLSEVQHPSDTAVNWMRAEMQQPVDYRCGPFFSFALFKIGPERFFWYTRYHHLIMDAFGAWLIATRVAQVYSALAGGSGAEAKPLGALAELISEDVSYGSSEHRSSDRKFWMQSLSNCPEAPSLSFCKSSEPTQFLNLSFGIPPDVMMRLEELARKMELSLPQVMMLCAICFVQRLTGVEDLVLGQMVGARMSQMARKTPAMLMNIVPVRLEIRSDMRVDELAKELRSNLRAGMRHQRYRMADMRRDIHRVHRPLFRQSVSVRPNNYDMQFQGARCRAHTLSNGPVDDLNIHFVSEQPEQHLWSVEFDANPANYDANDLSRLQGRFLRLLEAITDPATLVGRLDILPFEERNQLLTEVNNTGFEYSRDRQVHELFEDLTLRAPNRIAVSCGGQHLTYAELNQLATGLAQELSQLNIDSNDCVGLYIDRSLSMIVGLLAIFKAGGCYVPLDPNYPSERIEFILEDASPSVVITQLCLQHRLPQTKAKILCLDSTPATRNQGAPLPPCAGRSRGDLAYVIYTSGSTGQPKGVQVPHRALTNLLEAMKREPGIAAEDTLLSVTSLSFDISALELFLPLVAGARIEIAPADVVADGARLAALIEKCGATIMQATPATWRLLLEAGWKGVPLLKVLCGGEAWSPELASALLPRCASLWNMYGPTETTIWSSASKIGNDGKVLIGRPIANTKLYVLDGFGQLTPLGAPGELHIGGEGLAYGYLNRPQLTQERFLADPFVEVIGARMYKTGDLVRQLLDGRFEFLGRLDHQIKIRGYRIELGEIEAALRLHPEVKDAVVVGRQRANGDKRLIAYVTKKHPEGDSVSDLREFLRRKLAPYMIPAAFFTLEAFPLTPSGKVDRHCLPEPNDWTRDDHGSLYVAPRTPQEKLLCRLWCDCLQLERVGINDNFFDIGGDSLAMLRLSLEIERTIGRNFPLPWIYEATTVAEMAKMLDGETSASEYSPLVLLRHGNDGPPVFMVHPVGGSTIQLLPIAKSLPGDFLIYGVQARGLDGLDPPNDSVEAMAECYVEAIVSVQPHGPYILVGMCFGGLVAMEIARRLTARGEQIRLLALLDTYPHPRYWPMLVKLNYFGLRRLKESLSVVRTRSPADAWLHFAVQIRTAAHRLAAKLKGEHPFIKTPDSLPPTLKAVFDNDVSALKTYRPRFYPGKVNYLMCGYHIFLPKGPTSVWAKLIGKLDVDVAPALMRPDYVGKWLYERIHMACQR